MKKSRVLFMISATTAIGFFVAYATTEFSKKNPTQQQTSYATKPATPLSEMTFTTHVDNAQHQISESVVNLKTQIAKPRSELSTFAQQKLTKSVAPTQPLNTDNEIYLNDSTSIAEEQLKRHEQMVTTEFSFYAEPSNMQWANDLSFQLRNALDAHQIPESDIHNIECRSKTCRIEITNSESSSIEKSLPLILQQMGPSLPSTKVDYIDQGNGAATMVLYLSANY